MENKKVLVVAGVALAGVTVGGLLYLALKKKKNEDLDDDAFRKQGTQGASHSVTESQGTLQKPQMTATYSFQETEENKGALAEEHHAHEASSGAPNYERLGLFLQLPAGYFAIEEPSPIPRISMISIAKPEFIEERKNSAPGDIGKTPLIILSVEDIADEGLSSEEYKEKSKALAISQMLMMTNGMYRPQMHFEGALHVGPFTMCLEYSQHTPHFQMHVMNLIAVEKGLAYVLQIAAAPDVFQQYKSAVMSIARELRIFPKPLPKNFRDVSYAEVTAKGYTVHTPTSWKMSHDDGSECVFQFETASATKPDSVAIYKNDADAVLLVLAGAKQVSESQHPNGITCTVLRDATTHREQRMLTNGKFALLVIPMKAMTVTLSTDICLEVLSSVVPSNTKTVSRAYFSPQKGISFEASLAGVLVESRVGDGALLYVPDGINAQQEEKEGAVMTVRVEPPSPESEFIESVDEWYRKILSESGDGSITEIQREKINGNDAVSFCMTEMQEVGPGQREERKAKVVIMMNNKNTTMIRWEAATGDFKRYERQLTSLLKSFKLLKLR